MRIFWNVFILISDMACKRRIKYPGYCPKQLCSRSPSPTFIGSNTEDSNFKILCTNTLRERNPRNSPKYIQSETWLFGSICSHGISVSLHYNIERHLKYYNVPLFPVNIIARLHFSIVIVTLVTAGRLVSAGIPSTHFSHVFIDEAGHAMEPESCVALAGQTFNNINIFFVIHV